MVSNGNRTSCRPIRSEITRVKRESDLLIKSMITDRIGRQEVLLPFNHKYYTFRGP